MSHFKDRLQVFVIGLMLGLLIGCGFFILKLDDYFTELNFYKQLSQKQKEKTEVKMEDKAITKSKENQSRNKLSYKPISTVDNMDSTKKEAAVLNTYVDSLAIRDTTVVNANTNNEIVVRKDELLATRQVDMANLSVNANDKDSLLQKVSGIRDDKNTVKQSMNVEFWRSPINYRGYKMAKNKIVLFGVAEQDDIKLYHLDDASYIRLQQGVFKIDYTNDFRQFERINDESVLARLK